MGWNKAGLWVGDPVWLADVLRAEGLTVIEEPGWLERGHGDMREILGVIGHHTAGGGLRDYLIVRDGRPGLDGPLSQLVLERDGTYRVIAAGMCWHAGFGRWPGWPTNAANAHTIGIEAVNDGVGQPWPLVQIDAYERGVAAILRYARRGADQFAGHREWSTEGKPDPRFINPPITLPQFRARVAEIIERKPRGLMSLLDETITNYRGDDVTVRTLLAYVDQHTDTTNIQLTGEGKFDGWAQLGSGPVADRIRAGKAALEKRTVVDGLGHVHYRLDAVEAAQRRTERQLDVVIELLNRIAAGTGAVPLPGAGK